MEEHVEDRVVAAAPIGNVSSAEDQVEVYGDDIIVHEPHQVAVPAGPKNTAWTLIGSRRT